MDERDLHGYQRAAVDHIIDHPFCGLFLDMGLGKTVSTLTAIKRLYGLFEIGRVLVIAPKRVAEDTWTTECAKWEHLRGLSVSKVLGTERQRREALSVPADIYVINRENVAWLSICNINPLYSCIYQFSIFYFSHTSSFKPHCVPMVIEVLFCGIV